MTSYILWRTLHVVLSTGYTNVIHRIYALYRIYIYPVHHIVEFAYRITPTGLNYLHRIYPQDIQKYVLWVYPVEKFLNILYIVYPVGNLSFTDE